MNIATILPQNYLHMTRDDSYFMALGHLIGKPGYEDYTNFFIERTSEGKFVMMDNGLIEGDQRPIEELARKATGIGASEMILTDVFCKKEETLAAIEHDMEVLKGIPHPKPMLVAQGETIEDWVDCAHQLIMRYRTDEWTLGVPKVLVKLGGRDGRIAALYDLVERCPIARHMTVHLLGCWQSTLELTILDKLTTVQKSEHLPHVRGVDSAIPFVYARAGLDLYSADRPDSDPINFQESKVSKLLLRKNIYKFRRAADATRILL